MSDITGKKILALILIGVLAFSLAACSRVEERIEEKEEADELMQMSSWMPEGAVSIIVPAASGGNTDLSARVFAQYARDLAGVDFVIVNASGDSGALAANEVLASDPDGYTTLYGHTLVNMAYVSGITDYDYTAFTLGPTFAKDPAQGLYVNSQEYKDLDAFLADAKAAPGSLRACTETGAYTYYELLAFQKAAGIKLDLVDVGSNTDKIVAMLSSQCELMPGSYINTRDYIEADLFTCLGVPTAERSPLVPDLPTFREQGIDFVYPDQDFSFYFAPGTPEEIIRFYEDLVGLILSDEGAKEAIRAIWMEPYYLSAEDSAVNEADMLAAISRIAEEVE